VSDEDFPQENSFLFSHLECCTGSDGTYEFDCLSEQRKKNTLERDTQKKGARRGLPTSDGTTLAQACLNVEFGWDPVHSRWYDLTCKVWPYQCIYDFGNRPNFRHLASRGALNGMEE